MSPEFLAKIVTTFFAKNYRKNPERAVAKAIKYWQKFYV
jgi:hypothetical protein